ncbi:MULTISPECIES: hypothetical protein [unclassified Paracoccus (in: a-proteobacteria)]|uniref:hypothetical protein n=1 Tax=unclassified Paracoccus (in: a-proteobacteria) TaxID=2688777 RepID=UPI0012B20AB9|nr:MULTISPECIES: hypothetical protein [unclassified Paracoccus (in: a-proteobacteria)]UXU74684.1 hypothetical protein GB879_012435 [Paracoccus sp. SMMA_5]UXU80579.1 hypothetical protein GB880_012420 [Paracoccus sp. SMMA_5_TC]
MRLIKTAAILMILVLLGLVGYAYLGDMSSKPREMRMPVQLDLGASPQPSPATGSAEPAASAAPPAPAAQASQNDLD